MRVLRGQLAAVLAVALCVCPGVLGLDNGLARTPPMGFNPWNCFGTTAKGTQKLPGSHRFNESVIMAIADAFVAKGLRAAGYEYVNLDCGYSTGFRDANGQLTVNASTYPSGMKALADYVHARGLKFGICDDAGAVQCCSRVYKGANDGSLGHEDDDARLFASWGVDYVKHDGCGNKASSYPAMRDAIKKSGRPMVYSIHGPAGAEAVPLANQWRTTPDITNSWDSFMQRALINNKQAPNAGPGHWNNPDMLEVGNGLLLGEDRTHFALWCLVKAPLLLGTDLTNATSFASVQPIVTNRRAIAVNQDPLGIQGTLLANTTVSQVWGGRLSAGAYTVALVNTDDVSGGAPAELTFQWSMLGLPSTKAFVVFDIFANASLGTHTGSLSAKVPPHDVAFLTLAPA